MNPLAKLIPGLGQPLDFAAMAAGQGSSNPLADALVGSRQQNTLASAATIGNPQAQQAQAESLAAMMEAYRSAQGDQELAQELIRPQYAQNSGALGALAMIAESYAGRKLRRESDEKVSDYASRIFAEEQRMAQEQAAAQAKAEAERQAAKWAREDAVRADTQGFQLTLEERRAAERAERENARERRHRERLAQGGSADAGRMIGPQEAQAMGLAPGNYWIDRAGRPSPIQAPQAAPKSPEEQARAEALAKDVPSLQDARNAFNRYRELVAQYGTEQMPGEAKSQLQAAYGTARDAIRVLGNTGTLNVGELPFLEERMAPAASTLGVFGGNATADQILAQIDENARFLDEKEARIRGMSYEDFVASRRQPAATTSPSMGGQGMTNNLQNQPAQVAGWSVRVVP